MNKNGNSLIEFIPEIKEEIQKTIKNIESIKKTYKEKNLIYNNLNYEYINPKQKNKQKSKYHTIHITYFIPVLQFLDIKSLLELSKVNHIFYAFIYSIYFYRSTNQILLHSNKNLILNKKNSINNKSQTNQVKQNLAEKSNEENLLLGPTKKIYSSFMSALTGALSYIAPIPEISNINKEKNELEEIEKKINLHEKLIDERLKQLAITNEIKKTRAELDKYIKEQYDIKKNHKKNENNYINMNKINEQTIKKLKRDKYELEYKTLMNEISQYEDEYARLKKDNEIQNKNNIDLETKINKIKYYAKNKFLVK